MNDPRDYQTNSVEGAEAFERGRADEQRADIMYDRMDDYDYESQDDSEESDND